MTNSVSSSGSGSLVGGTNDPWRQAVTLPGVVEGTSDHKRLPVRAAEPIGSALRKDVPSHAAAGPKLQQTVYIP
jgi:hypothetical protein